MTQVGYLGPPGTFTHQAVLQLQTVTDVEPVPLTSVVDVIDAVESGEMEFGVVPIENSVEGEVTSTLDRLVFDTIRTLVVEDTVVSVTFDAFCRPEHVGHAGPWTVVSHPHALAQCQRFVRSLDAPGRQVTSTTEGCAAVAADDEPSLALAAPAAGELYGLVPFAHAVEDHAGAATRFFLLGHAMARPDQQCRTLLVVTPPDERAGVLHRILAVFDRRSISLSALSVRPLRAELGAYCFIATLEGHVRSEPVAAAVEELLSAGHSVKLLGSFATPGVALAVPEHSGAPKGSLTASSPEEARKLIEDPPLLP